MGTSARAACAYRWAGPPPCLASTGGLVTLWLLACNHGSRYFVLPSCRRAWPANRLLTPFPAAPHPAVPQRHNARRRKRPRDGEESGGPDMAAFDAAAANAAAAVEMAKLAAYVPPPMPISAEEMQARIGGGERRRGGWGVRAGVSEQGCVSKGVWAGRRAGLLGTASEPQEEGE